jgi:hypothetical protein
VIKKPCEIGDCHQFRCYANFFSGILIPLQYSDRNNLELSDAPYQNEAIMRTNAPKSHPPLLVMAAILSLSALAMSTRFLDFPQNDVTSRQDRDQMLWQLGIPLPAIPPKAEDPNRPGDLKPTNPKNPEGANWTDGVAGHTIARSTFGLWNGYNDDKIDVYTPIDLLKMKNGAPVKTPTEWWTKHRPEIAKDIQELLWGVIPLADVLPAVARSVTTSTGECGSIAFKEKTITGTNLTELGSNWCLSPFFQ